MPPFISNHFRKYTFALLVALAVFVWCVALALLPDGALKFYALDVGQGDAFFIETSRHNQVLIDGGPDMSVLKELGEVMPLWDKSIDLIILTHPQEDHMFGLVEVLKRYRVGRVVMTGVNYKTGTYKELKRVIAERQVPITLARAGQRIALDEGTAIDILYPFENLSGVDFKGDVNDSSVASLISFGKTKFIAMGDAGVKEETEVAQTWNNIDVDVLKVNHHGSRTSSNALFLEKIKPEFAVISVGTKNRYGHPTEETLERLKDVKLFRTDKNGRVLFISDGKEIEVSRENP